MSNKNKKIVSISDLHIGETPLHQTDFLKLLFPVIDDTDICVLNGDIFDLVHRSVGVSEILNFARNWITQLISQHPNTEFHYVLGNHDAVLENFSMLEDIARSHKGFFVHKDYFIPEQSNILFLHGHLPIMYNSIEHGVIGANIDNNSSLLDRFEAFFNKRNPQTAMIVSTAEKAYSKPIEMIQRLGKRLGNVIDKFNISVNYCNIDASIDRMANTLKDYASDLIKAHDITDIAFGHLHPSKEVSNYEHGDLKYHISGSGPNRLGQYASMFELGERGELLSSYTTPFQSQKNSLQDYAIVRHQSDDLFRE